MNRTILRIIVLIKKLLMLIFLLYLKKLNRVPKFEVGDRVRITKFKNIFRKGYTKKLVKEKFVIHSVWKTNPWTHKIKDLNGEKKQEFSMKKNCC